MCGALLAAGVINLSFWLTWSCDAPVWAKIIYDGSGSCAEFWLNRYQTLLGVLAALVGALMTIAAMQRQTEISRGDAAVRRLSEYTACIAAIMKKYTALPIKGAVDIDDTHRRAVIALREAVDHPTILQALTDPILGPDTNMLALFMNVVVSAAEYPREGDPVGGTAHLVWPLYMALTNSTTERQKRLTEGASASALQSISTINHRKFMRAYTHGEPVEP